MKNTFKLGALELKGLGVVKNIEITQEYTAGDAMHLMTHGKKFVQSLLKELPEMMLDVEKALDTYTEIDRRAYESAMRQYEEDKDKVDDCDRYPLCHNNGECSSCELSSENQKQAEPDLGSGIHVKIASGEEMPEHVKQVLSSILGKIEITRG